MKESTGRSSTQECSATQRETVFSQQRVAHPTAGKDPQDDQKKRKEHSLTARQKCAPHGRDGEDSHRSHTTTGLELWSSLTLETRSHPWVPAGHPQYTGAHHDGKAVDGPITTTTTKKSTAHSNTGSPLFVPSHPHAKMVYVFFFVVSVCDVIL